jgi:hypothetical protein
MLAGGLVSVFCANLPLYIQFLLSLLALRYAGLVLWKDILLRSKRAVVTLVCCDDNIWQLKERSGETYTASVARESTVLVAYCLLRFKSTLDRRKYSVVVFPDAIGAETYRRLLMKLSVLQ